MRLNLLNNMVKGMVKILPFYLFTFLPLNAGAQTFTDRIQQQATGEGSVTIHQDDSIEQLVNGNSSATTVQTSTPTKPNKQTTNTPNKQTGTNTPNKPNKQTANNTPVSQQQENHQEQQQEQQQQLANEHQQESGSNEVAVKRYRTTGYRVQVFRGGNSKADRQKAERAGNRVREAYPSQQVYVEFFSPEWTCRVGNFRDIEDARKMRDEIRNMGFENATIVRGKIIVSVAQ